MLRRLRRPAAALCAAVLIPVLAGCGESGSGDRASSPDPSATSSAARDTPSAGTDETGELSEVSFEGEVGESLAATWHSAVELPESTTVTTLVRGEGEEISEGDTVTAYLWVGNGTSQQAVFSDYDNGAPESLPNDGQLGEVFDSLFAGATYGSRVVAVTTVQALFGEAAESNPLGIGIDESVVLVADLVEKMAVSPMPTDDQAHDADPETQPKVVEEQGNPVGLDFTGLSEPALDAPVQRVILTEGDGAELKESDTVRVNYLGATFQAEKPFDQSYTREPLSAPLTGLIQGWSIGLTGVKVGSRVLLQIPPAYGYGATGSGPAIPGNATLWFLIDVLEVE